MSYLRSVHLHKDKSIFKLEELPTQRFAESLGLPGAPKIKFLSREVAKAKKNVSRTVEAAQQEALRGRKEEEAAGEESEQDGDSSEAGSDSEGGEQVEKDVSSATLTKVCDHFPSFYHSNRRRVIQGNGVRTRYDRMFERKNQNILSEHYSKLISHDESGNSSGSEEDFITLKRADHGLSDDDEDDKAPVVKGSMDDDDRENLSKRKLKLSRAKRTIAKGGIAKKLVFDDDGEAHDLYALGNADEWYESRGGLSGAKEAGKKFAEGERGKMQVTDVVDREEAREKKREKKRKRKEREGEREMHKQGKEVSFFHAPGSFYGAKFSCRLYRTGVAFLVLLLWWLRIWMWMMMDMFRQSLICRMLARPRVRRSGRLHLREAEMRHHSQRGTRSKTMKNWHCSFCVVVGDDASMSRVLPVVVLALPDGVNYPNSVGTTTTTTTISFISIISITCPS